MNQLFLYNTDFVLADGAPYTASVSTSALLPAKFGITLPANLVGIVIVPAGTVNLAKTTATGSTAIVPTAGLAIRCTAAVASNLALYAASPTQVDLYVYIPRNT
jgi:hypothetical protein